jgi:hypothetical protein
VELYCETEWHTQNVLSSFASPLRLGLQQCCQRRAHNWPRPWTLKSIASVSCQSQFSLLTSVYRWVRSNAKQCEATRSHVKQCECCSLQHKMHNTLIISENSLSAPLLQWSTETVQGFHHYDLMSKGEGMDSGTHERCNTHKQTASEEIAFCHI